MPHPPGRRAAGCSPHSHVREEADPRDPAPPAKNRGRRRRRGPPIPSSTGTKIGGRFAGTKHGLRCDPERRRKFYEELYSDEFTSDDEFTKLGFWGDDRLPAVNALWRKWFPEDEVGICPFIGPYPAGDQDICRVDRIPDELEARTVVVANEADEVVFRIDTEIWDSTRGKFQRTGFDGSVPDALCRCRAAGVEPAADWLAVTLDCHR